MRTASGIYDSVKSSNRVGIASNADNCVFGGADLKTLYITGDGGLYSIQLKIPGRPRPGEPAPTAIEAYRISPMNRAPAMPLLIRDLQGRRIQNPSGTPGTTPLLKVYSEKVAPQEHP
jgi:hypothetical protein